MTTIKELDALHVNGEEYKLPKYTGGSGININASNVVSADTTLLATKQDIANLGGFTVVSTLPSATSADTKIIYLLGPIGTGADKYEEWIVTETTGTKSFTGDGQYYIPGGFELTSDTTFVYNSSTGSGDMMISDGNGYAIKYLSDGWYISQGGNYVFVDATTITIPTGIYQYVAPITAAYDTIEFSTSVKQWTKIGETSIDLSDLNTKTFFLTGTTGQTNIDTAQAAVDWYLAGGNPILIYDKGSYILNYYSSTYAFFYMAGDGSDNGNSYTEIKRRNIRFDISNNIVTTITNNYSNTANVLATNYNYSTPYTPQYDGSPATKKYVDDSTAKVFYLPNDLTSASALSIAQDAYDWFNAGKTPIIVYKGKTCTVAYSTASGLAFRNARTLIDNTTYSSSGCTAIIQYEVHFTISSGTVTEIIKTEPESYFIDTTTQYTNPFNPTQAGHPATKKYVDDKVTVSSSAPTGSEGMLWYDTTNDILKSYDGTNWNVVGDGDMKYSDFSLVTKSGATVTLDLFSEIEPAENFTINAPSTIKEGQTYILRVETGATPYTMTLGTGITNPYSESTTLTANTVHQFGFLAVDGNLELQPSVTQSGGGTWGTITGTLSNQTDLQNALDSKTTISAVSSYLASERPWMVDGTKTIYIHETPTSDERVALRDAISDVFFFGNGLLIDVANNTTGYHRTFVHRGYDQSTYTVYFWSADQFVDGGNLKATLLTINNINSPAISISFTDVIISAVGGVDKSWVTKTISSGEIELGIRTIVNDPSANFTLTKPSTLIDGEEYVIRINSGSTARTMTLGNGFTNPWSVNLTLSAQATDQFVFVAINNTLELQPLLPSS